MNGDFSRLTFDPSKHFSGVWEQQGRVHLDADSNENLAILRHRIETEAIDVIGECGVPVHNAGFEVVTDFDALSQAEKNWLFTTELITPGVITYVEGGAQRTYTFVRGMNGQLFVNWWDGSNWHWADQGTPLGTTVIGSPGVITYVDANSIQRIYAFVQGANGHLFVNWWDGSNWHWSDQGTPLGTTVTSAPGVITYLQGNTQRIYAFVQGANGHLFVNWWDGSNWHWSDQGTLLGTTVTSAPGVITYVQGNTQRIYAFVRGLNGHLLVNWWDGSWHWSDQGTPSATTVTGMPGVITYVDANSTQRIYAFVQGANGHLFVNWWNGSWHWSDQGAPIGPTGTMVAGSPGVITYLQGNTQRIYAFVRGLNGHLLVNWWDGSWHWSDQGTPSATTVKGMPGVITYVDANSTQRIYAFVWGMNGHLLVNWWNGSWHWSDQGMNSLMLSNGDFYLTQGRAYVDGILLEYDHTLPFSQQPFLLPKDAGQIGDPGIYMLYLDGWERHITALEDPSIREVALGGPDTATRTQVVWQARLDKVGEIGANITCANYALIKWTPGRLRARTHPEDQPDDPCVLPPGAGYKRPENQLYRVEIHNDNVSGAATFKWSRDNGSVAVKIEGFNVDGSAAKVRVNSLGRDEVLGLDKLDWVEVLDDAVELSGKPGFLTQIADIDREQLIVTLSPAITLPNLDMSNPPRLHPKLRRWDSIGALQVPALPSNNGYIKLEDSGIEIKFEEGTLLTGDYWQIPARTIPGEYGDIEWPQDGSDPAALEPFGVTHHLCKLAILTVEEINGEISITKVEDCRKIFPPLTELPTGQVMETTCCGVSVGDGNTSHGDFNDIQQAVIAIAKSGGKGQICLLSGTYKLNTTVKIENLELTISGCGPSSVIINNNGLPVFDITNSKIHLVELTIEAITADPVVISLTNCETTLIDRCVINNNKPSNTEAGGYDAPEAPAIYFNGCDDVSLHHCYLSGLPAVVCGSTNVRLVENKLIGGGFWLEGGCTDVTIAGNEIRDGKLQGITLGGFRLTDTSGIDMNWGMNGVWRVNIHHNQISNMAQSAIGSAIGKSLLGQGMNGLWLLSDVTIAHNELTSCVWDEIDDTFDGQARGGIVLHGASHIRIHDNRITDHGGSYPACGIYLSWAIDAQIANNYIAENGLVITPGTDTQIPQLQGGIFLLPILGGVFQPFFSPPPPGQPAFHVHGNDVTTRSGLCLASYGYGSMSIRDNNFTSQAVCVQPPLADDPTGEFGKQLFEATCVSVFNLALNARRGTTKLPVGGNLFLARDELLGTLLEPIQSAEASGTTPTAQLAYHGNQSSQYGSLAQADFVSPTMVLVSFGDAAVQDNQSVCHVTEGTQLADWRLLAETTRVQDNWVDEGAEGTVFSIVAYGQTYCHASHNQVAECIYAAGGNVREVENQERNVDECSKRAGEWASQLPRFALDNPPAPQPPPDEKLRVLHWSIEGVATPGSLDPAAVNDSQDWTVIHLLHAGLLRLGSGESGLEYQPDLAEKWAVDEEGQMYTFTLRPGITFSNGATITANDVKFSLDRARAFTDGWSGPFYLSEIESVGTPDDLTVQVKLVHPSAYFLYQLTTAPAKIIPEASKGTDFSVTSGAFHIEPKLNNGFLLGANNNYWQPPGIDQVHIIFHANSDEALNDYDAGVVHVMGSLQTSVPNKGLTYPDLNKNSQSSAVRYLGFNHTKPPFDDPKVRLAVAHAINRDELINVMEEAAGATTRMVPPGVPYSSQGPDFQVSFNPDEALKLLDGVEQIQDIALYFAQEGNNQQMVDVIITQLTELFSQWASAHNIDSVPQITGNSLELREFSGQLNEMVVQNGDSNVQLYYSFWGADYPDPHNFLSQQLATGRGNNNGRYTNAEFDALVEQSDKELSEAQRFPLYRQAERIALGASSGEVTGDVALVPLFNPPAASLIHPDVTGLVVTSQGIIIPDYSKMAVPA